MEGLFDVRCEMTLTRKYLPLQPSVGWGGGGAKEYSCIFTFSTYEGRRKGGVGGVLFGGHAYTFPT